jgi:hypothetical protein
MKVCQLQDGIELHADNMGNPYLQYKTHTGELTAYGATVCKHMNEPIDCNLCRAERNIESGLYAEGHDITDCDFGCPEHGHIWRALGTH